MKLLKRVMLIVLCLLGVSLGAIAVEWDDTESKNWPEGFNRITIPSSVDGTEQFAVYRQSASNEPMPLVVVLHTWSGNYAQEDELVPFLDPNWHYIHPDFRGPNKTPEGCMGDKVIPDIDDSIDYALKHGNVDPSKIFVVGASGGGYATLGCFVRLKHRVNTFLSWVPISDLEAWYWQSKNRASRYTEHILAATSSEGDVLNVVEARKRSPLLWDLPKKPNGNIEIYTGIRDGYDGSVPTSHSFLFYNKLAEHYGDASTAVTVQEAIDLLSQGVTLGQDLGKLHENAILFKRQTGPATLTIFDGRHEMLPEACANRLRILCK